jgi:hypothetical protein
MKILLQLSLSLSLITPSLPVAAAETQEAVWHCSRSSNIAGRSDLPSHADTFLLASSGMNMDAIGLSVMDLIDVYSGKSIHVNGKPVTACFMPGETPLSDRALKSLGLNASTMQQQARKSAIVQSHFQIVTDEREMVACISKRFPAVGYLSKVADHERVVPCF